MRAIGASEKIASVSAGRMSCFEARPEQLEIAGDQAVDQVEAGDLRRRAEEHVEPAERRRRPAEQVVEDIDQDQAGEEHRQRHARGRDHAAGMIDQRAGPGRRQDAERHRDQHRDDQAEQRQLGRGRQPGLDFLADRLAGGQRVAEIAVREIVDVAAELHDQRLVEAELHADLLDRLLGRGGPGEIGRRIAGQRARQQEGDDHDADQARHRHQHSLEDHAEHRRLSFPVWVVMPGIALRTTVHDAAAPGMTRSAITPSRTTDSRAGGGTSTGSRRRSSASRR